jgi:hypothetical protein
MAKEKAVSDVDLTATNDNDEVQPLLRVARLLARQAAEDWVTDLRAANDNSSKKQR